MPRFMRLHARHPVITPRQVEAKASQTGRSEVTGSSTYVDDDDRELPAPPCRSAAARYIGKDFINCEEPHEHGSRGRWYAPRSPPLSSRGHRALTPDGA